MTVAGTLSSSLEDYLEAIYNIINDKKVARSNEIAVFLKVKKPSVTGALKILNHKGLVNYSPYEVITLTNEGEKTAKEVVRRHKVLRHFFVKILAVNEDIADEDACKIEHSISPQILGRLIDFIRYIETCPFQNILWKENIGFVCAEHKEKEVCKNCAKAKEGFTIQHKLKKEFRIL